MNGAAPDRIAVGVDLGGTNVRAGVVLFSDHGPPEMEAPRLLSYVRASTPQGRGVAEVVAAIGGLVRDALNQAGVGPEDAVGVGLGIPGIIRPRDGHSIFSPNFGWRDEPVGAMLGCELCMRTAVDNDVRVYTRGEWRFGAGRGASDLVCVTAGTGVGSGVVLNGELLFGDSFGAGEIGHITAVPGGVFCGCGKRGCVEVYASANGIARMARECAGGACDPAVAARADVEALRAAGRWPQDLSARDVAILAKAGDAAAIAIYDRAAEALAIGLSAAINLLGAPRTVVGGGVAEAGELLFAPLRRYLNELVMPALLPFSENVRAELGDTAAIVGGGWMALNMEG